MPWGLAVIGGAPGTEGDIFLELSFTAEEQPLFFERYFGQSSKGLQGLFLFHYTESTMVEVFITKGSSVSALL